MGTGLIAEIRAGVAKFLSTVGNEVRTEGQDIELWEKALAGRLATRAVEDVERLALHIANSGVTFSADTETAINGLHAAASGVQSVLTADLSPLPATEAPTGQAAPESGGIPEGTAQETPAVPSA